MKRLYAYVIVALILLSPVALEAQSFTRQYVSTVTNTDTGIISVENGITSTVGSVTLKWKVIECNFPPDWLAPSGFCDNKICYDLLSLLPGGTKTTNPYTGTGTFHFGTNLGSSSTQGCYSVKVLMYNQDIPTDTATETFTICKGALTATPARSLDASDIALYPNPAVDEVNLTFGSTDIKSIAVYNVIGKMVSIYKANGTSANLDITSIPRGIYFVRLMNSAGSVVATKRFTKQ